MSQETACPGVECVDRTYIPRSESISFTEIPGQPRLFTAYQNDPVLLRRYYPNAVSSYSHIADRIPEVLARHNADRDILCDALRDIDLSLGATQQTLDNIKLLRRPDTVAVVSGQQTGLFSGPIYTIYKALSAIRMAEDLRARGHNAVPVFWMATEDHDLDEVSNTFVIGKTGSVVEVKNAHDPANAERPVGLVRFGDSIASTIDALFADLPHTEFTEGVRNLVTETWRPGADIGEAFGSMLMRLLGKFGLILLSPLDGRLKKLAAPIYAEAVRNSQEIVAALKKRSEELVADGFAAQVQVGEDYFPLFWHADDGTRNALRKTADGRFKTKGGREFTLDELAAIAEREPERLSPSVVLRSVVQDHILPTVCYFGGGAEISYFAQSGEVYRVLGRPVTPVLHRQSFTVIEPKHAKALERYSLTLTDLFKGRDALLPEIVERYLNPSTAALFADVEERINTELHRLDADLSKIDQTLAENLAKRRRKVLYHIAALRKKFRAVQIGKDETIRRQVNGMFSALLPNDALQERSLNVVHFLNRYGMNVVDWVYRSIDLEDRGHRTIYL